MTYPCMSVRRGMAREPKRRVTDRKRLGTINLVQDIFKIACMHVKKKEMAILFYEYRSNVVTWREEGGRQQNPEWTLG